MKTKIMVLTLLVFCLGVGTALAHEHKHKHTAKGALHELKEAKEILSDVTPDAGGHIAKANQLIDQAAEELKAVASAAKA